MITGRWDQLNSTVWFEGRHSISSLAGQRETLSGMLSIVHAAAQDVWPGLEAWQCHADLLSHALVHNRTKDEVCIGIH